MPSRPECKVCPFRDHGTIRGAALVTGHARFCELLDVDSPSYNPDILDSYLAITANLNGLSPDDVRVEADESRFPPIATQVHSAVKAVGRFIASGLNVATEAEQSRRTSICEECPRFEDGRCRLCGCRTRWKVAIQSESCPDQPPKW